ncbi:MAG: hypothetical protein ACXAB7_18265 [Candidatus Kariarchaeaceae archaeon]|jgi:DNA-binding MarR family transcriptional regulator
MSSEITNRLQKIEQVIRIIETESCLLIYFHLLIFGESTPAELRKNTNLPKTTLFRNLSLLLDAEFVAKYIDDSKDDKRHSTLYYIKTPLREISNLNVDSELENHAHNVTKISIVQHWQSLLPRLPVIFTKLCSTIFLHQDETAKVRMTNRATLIDADLLSKCNVMLFTLFDAEDNVEIIEHFNQFLQKIDPKKIEPKTEGMQIPVALSINMLSFGTR